jgi:hypothetical protein
MRDGERARKRNNRRIAAETMIVQQVCAGRGRGDYEAGMVAGLGAGERALRKTRRIRDPEACGCRRVTTPDSSAMPVGGDGVAVTTYLLGKYLWQWVATGRT